MMFLDSKWIIFPQKVATVLKNRTSHRKKKDLASWIFLKSQLEKIDFKLKNAWCVVFVSYPTTGQD